jgi:hypothetical protein
MRDDVVADALVDLAGDNAIQQQIELGAIGPVADDALRPSRRHAGNGKQLLQAGVVDVHALLRGWRAAGLLRVNGSKHVPLRRQDRCTAQQAHADDCQDPIPHASIFLLHQKLCK